MATREIRQRGLTAPAVYRFSKVPQITIFFWIIKILTTAMGEAFADFMALNYSQVLAGVVGTTLFVVALLASGQSSTITGTLAGQVVMEGFMHWRIKPWVRRLITRSMAILPAVVIIGLRGDSSVTDLLTLSQVVLAFQLPFAMFPLLQFTSSGRRMGKWKNGWFLLIAGWASAILITAMDLYGLPDSFKAAWQVIAGG